jgi:Kef-type K+ transport system membrane component KefB
MKRMHMLGVLALFPALSSATTPLGHVDPVASVIYWMTLILFCGIMGRYLAHRCNQPGVLGELLMGVLVGNVCYFFKLPQMIVLREGAAIFNMMGDLLSGMPVSEAVHTSLPTAMYADQMSHALTRANGMDLVKVAYALDIFSRYGVVFLLFMAGLETSVEDIAHTGKASIRVALLGVCAPMILGFFVMEWLLPEASFKTDLFVGATLSATSVGITARVLKDMKKMRTREAKTILGAAMMDDVLGLIILAIVSSVVISGVVDMAVVGQVVLFTFVFFTGALLLGPMMLRKAVRFFRFLDPWEAKLVTSFLFVMLLAWLATCVQLAAIIGAFAAGVIIHDGFFDETESNKKKSLAIHQLVAPLESLLAPLFFMLIGIQVKLETFLDWQVFFVALGLIVAAVLGKLVSGWGASKKDDRLLIGIGMLPRGEVGLVFASIGRTLGVISDELFSAIILMVIVTTFMAPPWIKWRFSQHKERAAS